MTLPWVWLAILALALCYIGFASYKIASAANTLRLHAAKSQELISRELGAVHSEITPAVAHTEEDLLALVKQRRSMAKQKAARKQARQRRLVARIRDIEIDKRFLK